MKQDSNRLKPFDSDGGLYHMSSHRKMTRIVSFSGNKDMISGVCLGFGKK